VKWRNQLLALFCLVLFAAFGVFYFQHWVVQKPFGIVLFIGEGLTPSRIAATRVFAGGAETPLSVDSMPNAALVTNYSSDFAAPDAAAAASMIATGLKVNNRSTGAQLRSAGAPTLLDLARRAGRATGLITDGKITGATAAAFYARGSDPAAELEFARALTDNLNLDVVFGGGSDDFLPPEKGGVRKDARDLVSEIRRKGFDLVRTKAELEAIPAWRRPKVFGGFAKAEFAYSGLIEARSEQPSLPDMVRRAIELLQYNRGGYLLVVDANLMRKAAEQNDAEHTLVETLELDRAVAVARRYAGENSTIVVCGDVGIGGLHLNGRPFRTDRGIAVLGLNSAGDPWFSWATGPHAARAYGASKLMAQQSPHDESIITEPPQEPAAFYAPSALDTVEDVVVFGAGQGSEAFHGTLDNTAIFTVIRDSL
jgi:alkaline phosphatase